LQKIHKETTNSCLQIRDRFLKISTCLLLSEYFQFWGQTLKTRIFASFKGNLFYA